MEKEKRFKGKKLNKDTHKGMKKAAGGLKKGLGFLSVIVVAVPTIKKYGKEISGLARTLLFRR